MVVWILDKSDVRHLADVTSGRIKMAGKTDEVISG
jgi:hypothetical protein